VGQKHVHIGNHHFSYLLYNFYGAKLTIKDHLQSCQKRAQNVGFRGKRCPGSKFGFATLKRHILAWNCVIWCI